jgi:hypothetical protein
MKIIDKSTFIVFAAVTALVISSTSWSSALIDSGSDAYLQSIPPVLPPEIQENVVKYTIFLVFEKCPEQEWAYFDQDSNHLIIDFYSVHISKSPQVVLKGLPPVDSFEIRNFETDLSITGRRSQIVFKMDSFWHYQTTIISEKVLRLEIWKPLKSSQGLKKEEQSWRFPLVTAIASVLGAVITVGLLALFAFPDKS